MEMKSVSDCLNFIDSMIICNIEKHVGIGNLEALRDYMIGMCNEKYIEEMIALLSILSQINLIIDRFYSDNESDIKKQYVTLRKRILARLEVINAKREVDDQQKFRCLIS